MASGYDDEMSYLRQKITSCYGGNIASIGVFAFGKLVNRDAENLGAACWASSPGCWLTVLHGRQMVGVA